MRYCETIRLKDGRECLLRNAEGADAEQVIRCFTQTHGETDYLLTYPDENSFDIEKEREFFSAKADSADGVELCAFVDGRLAATAGFGQVGSKYKLKHRAEFGVSVEKAYWRLGVGRALTQACIELARKAGYSQLELDAVSDNAGALKLYRDAGFVEYGRNPRGFRSRNTGWQELVYMRLELD